MSTTVTAPDVDDFMNAIYDQEVRTTGEQHDAIIEEFGDMIEAVRQEARREALKEMDEAWWENCGDPNREKIEKLRQEYQGK